MNEGQFSKKKMSYYDNYENESVEILKPQKNERMVNKKYSVPRQEESRGNNKRLDESNVD